MDKFESRLFDALLVSIVEVFSIVVARSELFIHNVKLQERAILLFHTVFSYSANIAYLFILRNVY